jgi:hypothetical protein
MASDRNFPTSRGQRALNEPSGYASEEAAGRALFPTITGEDWRRHLALARSTPNRVRQQIRAAMVARGIISL